MSVGTSSLGQERNTQKQHQAWMDEKCRTNYQPRFRIIYSKSCDNTNGYNEKKTDSNESTGFGSIRRTHRWQCIRWGDTCNGCCHAKERKCQHTKFDRAWVNSRFWCYRRWANANCMPTETNQMWQASRDVAELLEYPKSAGMSAGKQPMLNTIRTKREDWCQKQEEWPISCRWLEQVLWPNEIELAHLVQENIILSCTPNNLIFPAMIPL